MEIIRKFPPWARALITAGGFVFTLAGVSTFWEDLDPMIAWLQALLPGGPLLLIGLGSIAIGMGPYALEAYRERRRLGTVTHGQALERPAPPSLPDVTVYEAHALDDLAGLATTAIAAMVALNNMLGPWLTKMVNNLSREHPGRQHSPQSYPRLFSGAVLVPMQQARTSLQNLRGSTDGAAITESLACAFDLYQVARGWVREIATEAEQKLTHGNDYAMWYSADRDFLREMEKARSKPSLKALDQGIANGEKEIVVFDPPPAKWG